MSGSYLHISWRIRESANTNEIADRLILTFISKVLAKAIHAGDKMAMPRQEPMSVCNTLTVKTATVWPFSYMTVIPENSW